MDNQNKKLVRDEHGLGRLDSFGNPVYPASEDIYSQAERTVGPDPVDDMTLQKTGKRETGKWNEAGFREDVSGRDLDVPGSEQDDHQENVGNEDEENNYYSLGGEDHKDLEEDRGD
jgi:hypothetical protein